MNLLICGLGSIGSRHLKILSSMGGHKFIALRSGISRRKTPSEIDKVISDIGSIDGLKTDAALITNPTSLHIDTAISLASKSIPMFIEKPLGKNTDNLDKLKMLVDKNQIPVLMGYNMLHHPGIKMMKKLISENSVGRIISARAQFGTYMPGWHPEEDYKKSYAALRELGGGVVLTSIHELNYLTDFFGEAIDVKSMEAGGNVTGIETEESVEILLKHSSGVVSSIHLNFFQKPYYRNCQIIGTKGTLYWDFMKPEVNILTGEKTETVRLGNDAMELLNTSYTQQMKHFINVVTGSAQPLITLDKGISDLKTSLKILSEIGRN